ncbi:HvfC family peptide modification chaperone, partial [Enterobacter hormaechei]|uniref:HvfC family peptide modification chaperone n=2 Tax=Gammaproteobacteria TaxID=1236 RepID=UPI00203C99A5
VHEHAGLEEAPATRPALLLLRRLPDYTLQVEQLAPLAYALLTLFGDDGTRVDEALQALVEAQGLAPDELRAACMPL